MERGGAVDGTSQGFPGRGVRARARWARLAGAAVRGDVPVPRRVRTRPRATPAPAAPAVVAAPSLPRPLHCDWAWRPAVLRAPLSPEAAGEVASGTVLAPGETLHHDRAWAGYAQGPGAAGGAPRTLTLRAGPGEGFVALAIDLPAEAARGLAPRHLLGLRLGLAAPVGGDVYLRLNLRHGPNLAQLLREVPVAAQRPEGRLIEFDLAYETINLRRVGHVWWDVIFSGAGLCEAVLTEATFTRRPRADM